MGILRSLYLFLPQSSFELWDSNTVLSSSLMTRRRASRRDYVRAHGRNLGPTFLSKQSVKGCQEMKNRLLAYK